MAQALRGVQHSCPQPLICQGGVKQCVRGDRKVTPGPVNKMTRERRKDKWVRNQMLGTYSLCAALNGQVWSVKGKKDGK